MKECAVHPADHKKKLHQIPRVQALKIQGPPLGRLGCLLGDALSRKATTGAEDHFWRKGEALSADKDGKKPFTSSMLEGKGQREDGVCNAGVSLLNQV